MKGIQIIIWIIIIWILWKLIKYLRTKQTRYIPQEIKNVVLKRYFNMCAVCTDTMLLEFHHRKEYSYGGDNSEKNIVPLCPKHHAMVRRLKN